MRHTPTAENLPKPYALIDTHTHFDAPEFLNDFDAQAARAYQFGVRHLVLVGYLSKYFARMVDTKKRLQSLECAPCAHLAFGLHPFYVNAHNTDDLVVLEQALQHRPLAVGEIGLDGFDKTLNTPKFCQKQYDFFAAQLDMAKAYKLPVLLHIRKKHAETLAQIKAANFSEGGIAHSFSGGAQEAKAFVAQGFKIGITGQVSNPNAKKLHRTITELVKTVGLSQLVIETDCPDFTPLCRQAIDKRRNTPANLYYVLDALANLLHMHKQDLAPILWQNSAQALRLQEVIDD